MLRVFVFFLSFLSSSLSSSPASCFCIRTHTIIKEIITFVNNYGYSTAATGYTLQAMWDSPQTDIVKSSFVLFGYQINHSPNPILNFDAALSNVTSTSVAFTFNPYNNSAIYYISFSIILLKTTSGFVELQYICNI